ncbi:MAG: putative porin [Verrucomicrobiota bacterium]
MKATAYSLFFASISFQLAFAGPDSQSVASMSPSLDEPETVWDRISLYGDLRLRYELDYDSVRGDGVTPREDRNRFRTRARLGIKFEPTDSWLFDVRVRHGNADSQQSPHVTWATDSGELGEQTDFMVDRLYLAWKHDAFSTRIGRQGLNYWKAHEMFWDDDVYIDGIAGSVPFSLHESEITINTGAWFLPDGEDDHPWGQRSGLIGAQGVLQRDVGQASKLTLADGLLFILDEPDATNSVNDDVDYSIYSLSAQLRSDRWRIPFIIGGDYYHNFDEGPAGDPNAGDTEGFVTYVKFGDFDEPGDMQIGYVFSYIEKYSVARFLAEDDFHRFGSLTQTRSSDFRGHEIRFAWRLREELTLVARAYFVDTLSNEETGNRFRLDLDWKF